MNRDLLKKAIDNYTQYREPGLGFLHIAYKDILPAIEHLKKDNALSFVQAGLSIEGRPINHITIGNGSTAILLWSQMHGNESTATKALFDILNFLTSDDELNELRKYILDNLSLHFIPMLNPDGAEVFTRENAVGIDLNRDASRLQCPESKILFDIRKKLNPQFCFNLHDQNRYYSVGRTNLPPAISFLAPPIDYDDTINESRKKGMQLIARLNSVLQQYIPGRVSKYPDDHEPRSFGDNFVKADSAVVLIESGYIQGDTAKEKIRELNFISLITAFCSIISADYKKFNIDEYYSIPQSQDRFYDIILHNVFLEKNGEKIAADLGIKQTDLRDGDTKDFYSKGTVEEIGDLSTCEGHITIDCNGLTAREGKIFDCKGVLPEEKEIEKLMNSGFTTILYNGITRKEDYSNLSVNITTDNARLQHEIKIESAANFFLTDDDRIKYLIVNGFITPIPADKNLIRNGLIFH